MLGRKSQPTSDDNVEMRGFDAYDLRLGDIMRGERATMGKSLLDVQRELKIKATYIAAVENSDPSVFETPGFIAGYVRSYARYLGMDPEEAFKRFCDESGFAGIEGLNAAPGSKSKPRSPVSRVAQRSEEVIVRPVAPYAPVGTSVLAEVDPRAIGSIAVVFALIAMLGFGGYSVLQEVQRVQFAPVDSGPGLVSEVDSLTVPSLAEPTASREVAGFQPPTADALDRLYRPQALDAPVLTARDGPIAALEPGSIGVLVDPREEQLAALASTPVTPAGVENAPIVPAAPQPKVVEDQSPEVVLFAVRPAWVRVANTDGTVLFEKILDAGERYVLPAMDEAPLLRAGNSGSLFFSVLGETLGPVGEGTSVAKNVTMGVEEIVANYQPADVETDPALTEQMMADAAAPIAALDAAETTDE